MSEQNNWRNRIGDISVSMSDQLCSIRKRQAHLKELVLDNGGLSAHRGNKISQGCIDCKSNKWVTIFVGKACNANCSFCPQPEKPKLGDAKDDIKIISTSYGQEQREVLIAKLEDAISRGDITSVGYSGGEPFLYLKRIIDFARPLNRKYPHLYQYVYTNGISVTRKSLQMLHDVGVREVRFDLAATNFSKKVMKKLLIAREIMEFLTIEVPAFPNVGKQIVNHADQLIRSGVDQINLCEAVVNQYNEEAFLDEQCYVYNPYEGVDATSIDIPNFDPQIYERVVPVISRNVTYDVLEAAEKNKWRFSINDCSQGVHFKPFIPY